MGNTNESGQGPYTLHEPNEFYDLHQGPGGMHVALYLRTILVGISIFLVPYLCWKFFVLKKHFVIHGRFPRVTVIAVISMLITTTTLLIVTYVEFYHGEQIYDQYVAKWAGYNFVGAFGQAFAMVFCCLIILRTHLLHEQWKTTQYRLKNQDSILKNSLSRGDSLERKKKYFSVGCAHIKKLRIYQCIAMFIVILFTMATYLFYFRTDPFLFALICMFTTLWGLGVFVIIITRRTKEALSCRHESYIVVVVLAAQLLNANLGRKYGLPKPWRYLISTTLSLACCYGILLTSLIMIYQIEDTIDPEVIFGRQKSVSRRKEGSKNSKSDKTGSNKNNDDEKDDVQSKSVGMASKSSFEKSFQGDLIDYLSQGRDSYDQFSAFLAECFALENLLYFVSVVVFRQVLMEILAQKLKHQAQHGKVAQDPDITDLDEDDDDINEQKEAPKTKDMAEAAEEMKDGGMSIVVREESESVIVCDQFADAYFSRVMGLKLKYLNDLYDKYRRKMTKMLIDKSYDDTRAMNEIAQQIYLQFIADDAIHIVNISWDSRRALRDFFNDCTEVRGPLYQFTIGSFGQRRNSKESISKDKDKVIELHESKPKAVATESNESFTSHSSQLQLKQHDVINNSPSPSPNNRIDGGQRSEDTNNHQNQSANPNLDGKTEIELIDKYLRLFNDSIVEVYGLMSSVFQFRYRKLIKQQRKNMKSTTNILDDIPE